MEKISSILPASPRITNVDLKNSGTARSGMPSYGRPQLEETGSARRHTQTNAMHAMQTQVDPHVDIVDQISKEFFMQKTQAPKSELSVDRDAIFGADADLNPATDIEIPAEESMMAPVMAEAQEMETDDTLDVPVSGGYLDVAV